MRLGSNVYTRWHQPTSCRHRRNDKHSALKSVLPTQWHACQCAYTCCMVTAQNSIAASRWYGCQAQYSSPMIATRKQSRHRLQGSAGNHVPATDSMASVRSHCPRLIIAACALLRCIMCRDCCGEVREEVSCPSMLVDISMLDDSSTFISEAIDDLVQCRCIPGDI